MSPHPILTTLSLQQPCGAAPVPRPRNPNHLFQPPSSHAIPLPLLCSRPRTQSFITQRHTSAFHCHNRHDAPPLSQAHAFAQQLAPPADCHVRWGRQQRCIHRSWSWSWCDEGEHPRGRPSKHTPTHIPCSGPLHCLPLDALSAAH